MRFPNLIQFFGFMSLNTQVCIAENKTNESVCTCGKMEFDIPTIETPFWSRFDYFKAESFIQSKFPASLVEKGQDYSDDYSDDYSENNNSDLRLVGGKKERPRPWLAFITKRLSEGEIHKSANCGGTLINHWYVITASHCVCPTDYIQRVQQSVCNEGKERIQITDNYPVQFDVCLAISNEKECLMEIQNDMSYKATEIVVRKERLKKNNLKTFDIALIKLDRKVRFNSDVSPVCLPGAIKFKKTVHKSAFASGFGITHFSLKDKKAECSTDMFLPRPYHTCSSSCQLSDPPADPLEDSVCNWLIYNYFDKIQKLRLDIIRITIPAMSKAVICYPNINQYGWCHINSTISHVDFKEMPDWGLCDQHCQVGLDKNGQFFFESETGTAYWARQTLLTYKECFDFLKGMRGAEDARLLDNFDPAFELCAGSIHEPRLQDFQLENLTISKDNIQGVATTVGVPSLSLPDFLGGTDTCQGDSGGPLWRWQVTDSITPEERVVQIGIIARGDKCARVNRPGIYTKISSFRDWIKKNTRDGGCDRFE